MNRHYYQPIVIFQEMKISYYLFCLLYKESKIQNTSKYKRFIKSNEYRKRSKQPIIKIRLLIIKQIACRTSCYKFQKICSTRICMLNFLCCIFLIMVDFSSRKTYCDIFWTWTVAESFYWRTLVHYIQFQFTHYLCFFDTFMFSFSVI